MTTNIAALKSPEARFEVEEILYKEAALLDAWELLNWLELYTHDAVYEVAPTGIADPFLLDPEKIMFLVADNRERMEQRVIRLNKPTAHVEFPKSITRHLYTNIRIVGEENGDWVAMANCMVFRTKNRTTNYYPGNMRYVFRREGEQLQIRAKRVALDLEALIPQGKVSIIL